MGSSIIINQADFSASRIKDGIAYASVDKVRALAVDYNLSASFGGKKSPLFKAGTYGGRTYIVPVGAYGGEYVKITFKVGYSSQIFSNGGFLRCLPEGLSFNYVNGWDTGSTYFSLKYISGVCGIEQSESDIWVTKTYRVPESANYLIFTSKYDVGKEGTVEFVKSNI